MLPLLGASASGLIGDAEDAGTIGVTLIQDTTDLVGGNTTTISVNVGDAAPGRIVWVMGSNLRSVTTGSVGTVTATLDGLTQFVDTSVHTAQHHDVVISGLVPDDASGSIDLVISATVNGTMTFVVFMTTNSHLKSIAKVGDTTMGRVGTVQAVEAGDLTLLYAGREGLVGVQNVTEQGLTAIGTAVNKNHGSFTGLVAHPAYEQVDHNQPKGYSIGVSDTSQYKSIYFAGLSPHRIVPTGLGPADYWFAADHDVYADLAGSNPCLDGQGVARWGNQGIYPQDAQQSIVNRRPKFRTNGLAGFPYIECRRENFQFFEDLMGVTQPSGTNYNYFDLIMVVDQLDLSAPAPIFSGLNGATSKVDTHFQETTGVQQVVFVKPQVIRTIGSTGPMVVMCSHYGNSTSFSHGVNRSWSTGSQATNPPGASNGAQFLRRGG